MEAWALDGEWRGVVGPGGRRMKTMRRWLRRGAGGLRVVCVHEDEAGRWWRWLPGPGWVRVKAGGPAC